jgi:hypothetical protein
MRNTKSYSKDLKVRDCLDELGIDVRIILKWI